MAVKCVGFSGFPEARVAARIFGNILLLVVLIVALRDIICVNFSLFNSNSARIC